MSAHTLSRSSVLFSPMPAVNTTAAERVTMGKYPEYLLSHLSSIYKYGTQYPHRAMLEDSRRVAEENLGRRNSDMQIHEGEVVPFVPDTAESPNVSGRQSEVVVPFRPESESIAPSTPIQPPQSPIQGELNFDAVPAQVVPPTAPEVPKTASDIVARGVENQFESQTPTKTPEQSAVERAEKLAAQHRTRNTPPINAEFDWNTLE